MGSPDDPSTGGGPELRVRGIDGLRIADASVFPSITAVNLVMTRMMIGERCAEMLRSAGVGGERSADGA
jgi:choline dehydrogenase